MFRMMPKKMQGFIRKGYQKRKKRILEKRRKERFIRIFSNKWEKNLKKRKKFLNDQVKARQFIQTSVIEVTEKELLDQRETLVQEEPELHDYFSDDSSDDSSDEYLEIDENGNFVEQIVEPIVEPVSIKRYSKGSLTINRCLPIVGKKKYPKGNSHLGLNKSRLRVEVSKETGIVVKINKANWTKEANEKFTELYGEGKDYSSVKKKERRNVLQDQIDTINEETYDEVIESQRKMKGGFLKNYTQEEDEKIIEFMTKSHKNDKDDREMFAAKKFRIIAEMPELNGRKPQNVQTRWERYLYCSCLLKNIKQKDAEIEKLKLFIREHI